MLLSETASFVPGLTIGVSQKESSPTFSSAPSDDSVAAWSPSLSAPVLRL